MDTNAGSFPAAERPSVTVDVLIFTVADGRLKVALVERGIEPFKGRWALPGGFVLEGEALDDAALREVREEAGVRDVFLEQFHTFGAPGRDPRRRVITVAYFALVPAERIQLEASTDAADVKWFAVEYVPPLAFDHDTILKAGVERLRDRLEDTDIAAALLPGRFRLSELQSVYEAILARCLDKRNFRKRILSLGLVEPTDAVETGGAHRPARLFRFAQRQPERFE